MENSKNVENIEDEIKKLKMEKKKIEQSGIKKSRSRCNNYGRTNELQRVDTCFKETLYHINSERKKNGRDAMSLTMLTRLFVRHEKYSKLLINAIILYNTDLEEEEFNDK